MGTQVFLLSTLIPIIFFLVFLPLLAQCFLLLFYDISEVKLDRGQIAVLAKALDFGRLEMFNYCF